MFHELVYKSVYEQCSTMSITHAFYFVNLLSSSLL